MRLGDQQAHVWYGRFDQYSNEEVISFLATLSTDEKTRAEHFRFVKHRTHFIIARGLLREIIGHYLDIRPTQLIFSYNAYGKPELKDYPQFYFNLAHAHNIAIYAIGRQELGIDTEYTGRTCDIEAIARHYFSSNEYHIIRSLSEAEKVQAFFNGWTRKEAFLKAIGRGLSFPLNQVEVTLAPDQPAMFTALHDERYAVDDWSLYALDLLPGYVAALATKGKLQSLSTGCWKSNKK